MISQSLLRVTELEAQLAGVVRECDTLRGLLRDTATPALQRAVRVIERAISQWERTHTPSNCPEYWDETKTDVVEALELITAALKDAPTLNPVRSDVEPLDFGGAILEP